MKFSVNFILKETTDGFNPCYHIKDSEGNYYGIWGNFGIFQRFAETVGLERLTLWNEKGSEK